MHRIVLFGMLAGCAEEVKQETEPLTEEGDLLVDADGDGYLSDEDCDDNDSTINPSSEEVCDGYDNNCNGLADEDVTSTYFADSDSDGFGSESITTQACEAPSGYVSNGSDCNDTDASTYPSADELCDEADNDCNGEIDDGLGQFFYVDQDGDGFGNEAEQEEACDLRIGLSAVGGDCDDGDSSISPASAELCDEADNDCDGEIDEEVSETYYADEDLDGYGTAENTVDACDLPEGYVQNTLDCNDNDTLINPAADEHCDGQDNDCDNVIDEDLSADALLFYADEDEDGFGDPSNTIFSCAEPEGYTTNSEDCDDNNGNINPQAQEYCNSQDDDCDGETDEDGAEGYIEFYGDGDGDGFGDPASVTLSCSDTADHVTNALDCDDNDNDVNPDAAEVCDGIDNNCDGSTDEDSSTDAADWFFDGDGDGQGDPEVMLTSCVQPDGHVETGTDCDDTDPQITEGILYFRDSDGDGYGHDSLTETACEAPIGFSDNSEDCDDGDDDISPAGTELCNLVDDNCDGEIDENNAADASLWYSDADLDGFGDSSSASTACSQPDGHVANGEDCDDHDDDIRPSAEELCNGEDDDCDGDIDGEAEDAILGYLDGDGDGFGSGAGETACVLPDGQVENDDDCDDADGDVNPSAEELCDSVDNDCDGEIDGGALDVQEYYEDSDSDGYGDAADTAIGCDPSQGYVDNGLDCDDDNNTISPDAAESCNGIDDDCDGDIDGGIPVDGTSWYEDGDGDGFGVDESTVVSCDQPQGFVAEGADCDDNDNDIFPGAVEYCNQEDDDCDEETDEEAADATVWYEDLDEDGYGDSDIATTACEEPEFASDDGGDCDDGAGNISPGAVEACNDVDDDCDGEIDEDALLELAIWYADADGDGYGAIQYTTLSCSQPEGYVADATDCNDSNAAVNTADTEICDDIDNDCDGEIDEPDEVVYSLWYEDGDSDGFGDLDSVVEACAQPDGFSADSTDCDDSDGGLNPDNGCGLHCDDLLDKGFTEDGNYIIDPDGPNNGNDPYEAYCDMTTDDGGWTLVAAVVEQSSFWTASSYDGSNSARAQTLGSASPEENYVLRLDRWRELLALQGDDSMLRLTVRRIDNDADVTLGFLEGIQMNGNGNFENAAAAYNSSMDSLSATGTCIIQYQSNFNSEIVFAAFDSSDSACTGALGWNGYCGYPSLGHEGSYADSGDHFSHACSLDNNYYCSSDNMTGSGGEFCYFKAKWYWLR
jgi:large repetitive protein